MMTKSSEPTVSAIVVTFHTGPILDACLDALVKNPACTQVIIVNNGNPNDVVSRLEDLSSESDKVLLLSGHGNVGFGVACNLGAGSAQGDVFLFVNPDCILDPSALASLVAPLTSLDPILVGGRIVDEAGREQRGGRRGELTLWSALISFSGLARPGEAAGILRDFNREREPHLIGPAPMPVVSGALMAMRKQHFEALNGFDPDYFLHVEDVDICQRFRQTGGHVLFVPEATALHLGSTSDVSSWRVEAYKFMSFFRYFWTYARSFLDKGLVLLAIPLLAAALSLRWLISRLR